MQHKNTNLARQIGANIRTYRQAKLIKQAQLARLASMQRSQLNHIELGDRLPNVEVLQRLTRALRVKICDVVPE